MIKEYLTVAKQPGSQEKDGLSHKQDLAVGTEAVARSKSGIMWQEVEQQVLSFPLSWWILLGIFYVLV